MSTMVLLSRELVFTLTLLLVGACWAREAEAKPDSAAIRHFGPSSATPAVATNISPGDTCLDHEDIVIGKRFQLNSDTLEEARTIELYLPDGYLESEETYPVLVVLDGGELFRYCVSIVDMISPNHLPQMIIVGLPNTDRNRDLHPFDSQRADPEAAPRRFLRFLGQELIPYVEKHYRALPYRILAGHSLAGLFVVYALAEEPDLFTAYIATSPSIGAPERRDPLLERLQSRTEDRLSGKYLYFSVGGNESEALHSSIRELDSTLEARQGEELDHHFDFFDEEGHVPIKGFYHGLRKLFPSWIPKLSLFLSGDLNDIRQHYTGLSEKYGFPVSPPPDIVNSVGRRMLRDGNSAGAVEIYQYYVSLYPRSVSGRLALAEAHVKAEQSDEAIEVLKRALELEPDNESALNMLEELEARARR